MKKNRLKPHFQHSNCDRNHATASPFFHFLLGVVFVEIVKICLIPALGVVLARRTALLFALLSRLSALGLRNATFKSRAPILGRLIYLNQFITILSI